jgi:hypothetical protein
MINIIKNPKPKLKMPSFSVDTKLDKKLELYLKKVVV